MRRQQPKQRAGYAFEPSFFFLAAACLVPCICLSVFLRAAAAATEAAAAAAAAASGAAAAAGAGEAGVAAAAAALGATAGEAAAAEAAAEAAASAFCGAACCLTSTLMVQLRRSAVRTGTWNWPRLVQCYDNACINAAEREGRCLLMLPVRPMSATGTLMPLFCCGSGSM